MPQYNRNDFYPRTGDEIDSNGNVKNEADGLDTDGTQFVKGKVSGPILLDTIPYSAITASTNTFKSYVGVLSKNAKQRTFFVTNALNQPTTLCNISPFDSIARNTLTTYSNYYSGGALTANNAYQFPGSQNGILNSNVDSFQLAIGMGATAPTSGNIYVYVTEVF